MIKLIYANCAGCAALQKGETKNHKPTCVLKHKVTGTYNEIFGWQKMHPESGVECTKPTTEKQLRKELKHADQ